jgi:DNA-binding protein HU-beta
VVNPEGKLVNKNQLIETLAARYDGNKKAARHALESVLDTITREVAKGEKVAITGFGSFEKRVRNARMVRNPRTGERIKAKATQVPKFTAGQDLKNIVSGAKKLPKLTLEAAAPVARVAAAAAPAKKTTTTKTAKKAPAKKAPAKKAPAKKAAAKKAPAKK